MTVKVSKPHLDDRAGRPPEKRTFVGADTWEYEDDEEEDNLTLSPAGGAKGVA